MKITIDTEITEQTSSDFVRQASMLDENESLEIEITSEGGSVTAGNVIVSKIRELSKSGHKTTAHVVSIAASMASVIACACDELTIDSNAFLMVHCVWTCVQGNANELRKEAETLDLFTKSLISVYRTKFNKTDDEIMSLLEAETWILGEQAKDYGLNCIVNDIGSEIRIAASLKKYNYKNMPKGLNMEEKEIDNEKLDEKSEENIEQTVEQTEETEEKQIEETKPTYEELEKKIQELEEELAKCKNAEDKDESVESRLAGLQSKLQKNFNAQLNDLMGQLKSREEELVSVKAEATSLKDELESKAKELSEKASALAEKENALAMLNAGVNKMPTKTQPSGWNSLEGKEFFDYLKKNNGILTIKNK